MGIAVRDNKFIAQPLANYYSGLIVALFLVGRGLRTFGHSAQFPASPDTPTGEDLMRFNSRRNRTVEPSSAAIFFSKAVLEFTENQVLHFDDNLETGGVLFGKIGLEGQRTVLAASPPGPIAVHRPAMFSLDVQFAQFMIDELYARHTLIYLGEWHKHPRNCTAPSAGDEEGCRSILRDPAYRIAGLLLFPIFTVSRDGKVEPHYFCMDDSLTYRTFTPIVEDREHFMGTVQDLAQQYSTRSVGSFPQSHSEVTSSQPMELSISGPTNEQRPHWYATDDGKRQLAATMQLLKTRVSNMDTRLLNDGRLAFIIRGPAAQELTIICEDSHPHCAPTIQVTAAGGWKTSSSLGEFISEVHGFLSRGYGDVNIVA
jgi:integrative and conjugative element protein (TIGR02256 family)